MAATLRQIQEASARLAMTASFPGFVGGLYAFTSEDLDRGCWFPLNSVHPLLGLAFLVVAVPVGSEPYALKEARCRIAIEDGLAALGSSRAQRPAGPRRPQSTPDS
jgi:hypothetical protein